MPINPATRPDKVALLNAIDSARVEIRRYRPEMHPTSEAFDIARYVEKHLVALADAVKRDG